MYVTSKMCENLFLVLSLKTKDENFPCLKGKLGFVAAKIF
jgi:hypothetical protein